MDRLLNPLILVKMKRKTTLRANLQAGFKSGSIHQMVLSHTQLWEHVMKLEEVEIDVLLLS